MATEDWLNIDENVGVSADANQEVQIDYGVGDGVDNDVESPPKKACCTLRRMLVFGLVGMALVAAAGVSVWQFVLKPSNSDANGSHSHDKQSIGGNRVPAPTPATFSYGGRPTSSPGPTASNAGEIAEIIDGIARQGGAEFKNSQSYQSLAKKWVLTQDFPIQDGSSMTTEQQARQLYALACIFYATFSVKSEWTDNNFGPDVAIPGWYSSRGWLGTGRDVCSNWHGLSCDDQGRVQKIELDTNGLTGAIPPETALLKETLNTIDLYNNFVHNVGDEGSKFLGELVNLEFLYLGKTSFQYEGVPPSIGKLTKLKELDLSNTFMFGSLDGATFANLSNLRYLSMENNAYNSPVPIELAQLPNLQYLYAGFSNIEGSLDFMASMPKIAELWLDDNPELKGTIPSSIGNMKQLASFSVSNCGLTGTIPSEIGAATSMVQMWLDGNELSGAIPPEFSNMPMMQTLIVSNNGLTGEMPEALCSKRRPFGSLEELGADCDDAITCGEECCTCCGDSCSSL